MKQTIRQHSINDDNKIDRIFSSINTSLDFIRLEKLSLADFNPIFLEELLIRLVSFPCVFSLSH